MRMSIIGLPFAGKTSVFEILTTRGQAGALSGKRAGAIGTAFVPDPRLDQLSEIFQPKKQVNAAFEFADTPALAIDEGSSSFAPGSLDEVRKADTCCLVLQCFDSPMAAHPLGDIDPARDLAMIASEFLLLDLATLEKTAERLEKVVASGKKAEDRRQLDAVQKAMAALEAETPLRQVAFSDSERAALSGYQLLSLKPLLIVLNVGEDRIPDMAALSEDFRARHPELLVTALCAGIELELARMAPDEAAEFMADLDLREPALDRLLQACVDLLNLQVFFTVGPDECRAWPIPRGSTAYDAAGAIHTDFQRGFIRAVVMPCEELIAAGDPDHFKREARQEKKDYLMQDGDVVEFRFSVSK